MTGTILSDLHREMIAGRVRSVMILGPSYVGDKRGVSVHLHRADHSYVVGYGPTLDRALEGALRKLRGEPDNLTNWEGLI